MPRAELVVAARWQHGAWKALLLPVAAILAHPVAKQHLAAGVQAAPRAIGKGAAPGANAQRHGRWVASMQKIPPL